MQFQRLDVIKSYLPLDPTLRGKIDADIFWSKKLRQRPSLGANIAAIVQRNSLTNLINYLKIRKSENISL